MNTSTRHTPGMIARVKQALGEMNYAQRRLFELRTGFPTDYRSSNRRQLDELEAVFRAKGI